MIDQKLQRVLDAARRVVEGRLLVHRVPDPEKPLVHAEDCAACELRSAVEAVDDPTAGRARS